jgi:DNA-binding NarL/FixJ family response regulator
VSGTVLVVEDDGSLAELVATVFRPHWPVRIAHNVWHAVEAIGTIDNCVLALVDLDVPGPRSFDDDPPGGGFEVIRQLRARFPEVTVVVVTAHMDPRLINVAQRLRAELVIKLDYLANLRALVDRLLDAPTGDSIDAYARRLQREHRLTERQREVVTLAIRGLRNVEIAEALSISINTLKAHAREILRACGVDRLSDIARDYWRR